MLYLYLVLLLQGSEEDVVPGPEEASGLLGVNLACLIACLVLACLPACLPAWCE